MKRSHWVLGATLVLGIGMSFRLASSPPAAAEPEKPILSTYEQQKKWIEGDGTSAFFVVEAVPIVRKGDKFAVGTKGEEVLSRQELLKGLKLRAAQNRMLDGQYLNKKMAPAEIVELLVRPESVGKTFVLQDGPEVIEVHTSDKFEMTSEYRQETVARVDLEKLVGRAGAQKRLTSCKSNLKNLATACEMYCTDWSGNYPHNLGLLTPNYMKIIPPCPAGGTAYAYEWATVPDMFTMVCKGSHHLDAGTPANYPQYSAEQGLIERPYK